MDRATGGGPQGLTRAAVFAMLAAPPGPASFPMTMRIPIGIDDFRELREKGLQYVDKSHLIQELIDRPGVKVALLPRPRRFGKSLNLSMLRWFFQKRSEDLWHLFEGLRVAGAGEAYRAHFQRYPVVYISFKATKAERFEVCWGSIKLRLRDLYEEHWASLEGTLSEWDRADFRAVLDGTADEALYRASLFNLTKYLHRAHGERVVVLIDEYDAPIHAGFANGYYREIVDFFRGFFEAGLKDNPHLHKGVLTGILRVAKESIFSGLNNLAVSTLLAQEFNTCFGFTEAEVAGLLQKAGLPDLIGPVREYYNGYDFGGEAIYNPWSILHFLAKEPKVLAPYWMTTSTNDLIKTLLQQHAFSVEQEIEVLLAGGSFERRLDENIVFPELKKSPGALWDLLVFSGYLKATQGPVVIGQDRPPHQLSIPNREVAEVYRTTFRSWLDEGLRAQGGAVDALLGALLRGDTEALEEQLQALAAYLPSYHDVKGADPEKFHHGLMIGLLAGLEPDYEVRSNRESGDGRPDVTIRPRRPGKPGAVLELKTARRGQRTLQQALAEGLAQMRQGDYGAELRAAGVPQVHALVIAFDGKRARVESADAPKAKTRRAPASRAPSRKPAKKAAPRREGKAKKTKRVTKAKPAKGATKAKRKKS